MLDESATDIAKLNPFRYRSYYLDVVLNLYYLKTRYYDPEICRFTTIDDLKYLRPDTINGINLYAYCRNNPIKYIDSEGTDAVLVTIYRKYGLPIVGHSIMYIKKDETWYEVQYTGDVNDKINASVQVSRIEGTSVKQHVDDKYGKLSIEEIKNSNSMFTKITGYISLIHGDKVYDYIEIKEDYSDLIIFDENGKAVLDESKVDWDVSESYWLLNHNCLHFAKSVLNTVESSSKTVEYYKKYSMTIVPSFYHWGYYFADKFSKYTDPLVEKAEQHLATSLPYITQILDSQRASWKAFSQLVNMPLKSFYLKYIEPLLR